MDLSAILLPITLLLTSSFETCQGLFIKHNLTLHLTPYIQCGEITLARELSLVNDSLIPRSHAGFITVDIQLRNHLFFWFFPAINSDPQSPLLVWLNGGPGVSSMVGLFFENGPLRISEEANIDFIRWNKSWAEKFSMLYIDQPVGVGYSYTEDELHGYRVNQEGCSGDLYEFIKQFYRLFPEYTTRDLYLGGQSYAGKYIPALAYRIHTEILANKSKLPLKGIYLGAPMFDVKIQARENVRFYETLGVISKKQANDFQVQFDIFAKEKHHSATFEEFAKSLFPNTRIKQLNNYFTFRAFNKSNLDVLMKTNNMRDILRVGNTDYNSYSKIVTEKLLKEIFVSQASTLSQLMDNYKVLIYNGDVDGIVTSGMLEAGLMTLNWSRQSEYSDSIRQVWGSANNPKGFYTQTGQFCRVVLRGAGHDAPFDQPDSSREMIEMFLKFGCIQENIKLNEKEKGLNTTVNDFNTTINDFNTTINYFNTTVIGFDTSLNDLKTDK